MFLGYDTKQSDGVFPLMLGLWWKRSTPSLPSLTGSLWPGVVGPDRALFMSQIGLNWVLMLNRIVWNRIIWNLNCVLMLNWIVWKRTVFDIESLLCQTELFEIEHFWHLTVCKKEKLYLY